MTGRGLRQRRPATLRGAWDRSGASEAALHGGPTLTSCTSPSGAMSNCHCVLVKGSVNQNGLAITGQQAGRPKTVGLSFISRGGSK